jgi:ankyrin repeat protein
MNQCLTRSSATSTDVNTPAADSYGRTALQAASGDGHLEVMERLLAAGADVNAPVASGCGGRFLPWMALKSLAATGTHLPLGRDEPGRLSKSR